MKFFLDTANLEEIRQGVSLGVIDGVTTNPTLIAKEKRPFREHILEICNIVKDGVVNAEVVSTDTAGIPFEGGESGTLQTHNILKNFPIPPAVRAPMGLPQGGKPVHNTPGFCFPHSLLPS